MPTLRGPGNNAVLGAGCSHSWRHLVVECSGHRPPEATGHFRELPPTRPPAIFVLQSQEAPSHLVAPAAAEWQGKVP